MTVSDILQRIQSARALDFGAIFNESIELFKKVWVQGLITVLLNMMLAIPVVMLIYIPLFFMGVQDAIQSASEGGSYYNDPSNPELNPIMMAVMFVIYVIAIIVMSTLAVGLRSAFYRICKLKDFNEMGKEDYFFFFKKQYLGKTFKVAIMAMVVALLAALLCFLPLIYAIVPLSYVYVVYAFNPDKSVSDIFKLSFELGNKKWLITFGLLIVCGLLAGIVGFVLCFVGVYVTQSFGYLPPYLIYKDIVGFDEENSQPRLEAGE